MVRARVGGYSVRSVLAVGALVALVCAAVGLGGTKPSRAAGGLPMLEYPTLGYTTAPHYSFTCYDEVLASAAMYLPQEAMVYLVVHQTPTREMVRDLAERMGVPISDERYAIMSEFAPGGGNYSATVGVMSPDSLGDLDVTLSDDGNYLLTRRSEQPGDKDPDAPSDDRAVAAAEDFVNRSGLLPKECRFERVGLGQAVTENLPGGGSRQKPLGTMVTYSRELGGIPDGSFAIRINGREQVYNVSRNARECDAVPRLPPPHSRGGRGGASLWRRIIVWAVESARALGSGGRQHRASLQLGRAGLGDEHHSAAVPHLRHNPAIQ